MGLAVSVGMLDPEVDQDPEDLELCQRSLTRLNEVLIENGLPAHREPERLPPLMNRSSVDGYPYSCLHYLRRAYAHRVEDPSWVAQPLHDKRPTDDPVLKRVANRTESHLLWHSDAEGYYVPIDFERVLFDERERVPGGMLGSSYRLRDELVLVAPALGIRLSRLELPDSEADSINDQLEQGIWIERMVWLSLFEASRLSIKHGALICFG